MLDLIFTFATLLMPIVALRYRLPVVLGLFLLLVALAQPHIWAASLFLSLIVQLGKLRIRLISLMTPDQFALCGFLILMFLTAVLFSLGSSDLGRALSELLQYLLILLTVAMISLAIRTRDDLIVVLGLGCVGSVIVSVCTIGNMLGIWQLNSYSSFIAVVPNNYAATFSLFAGVIAPLAILFVAQKPRPLLLYGVALLNILNIIIINSRASQAVLVVTVLAVLWCWKESWRYKLAYAGCLLLGFAGLFTYLTLSTVGDMIYDADSVASIFNFENNTSNLERIALIQTSFDVFMNHAFGIGLGSGDEVFYRFHGVPHPHNTLALFVVEMGVIGMVLYLLFLLILLRMVLVGLAAGSKDGFLLFVVPQAAFLFSLSDPIQYNGQYMILVFIFLALAMVRDNRPRPLSQLPLPAVAEYRTGLPSAPVVISASPRSGSG